MVSKVIFPDYKPDNFGFSTPDTLNALSNEKRLEIFEDFLMAITSDDYNACENLLRVHQDLVNEKDHNNNTALMWAAWKGRVSTVELLIKRGANVNAKTNSGNTALTFATIGGHIQTATLLRQHDAK